MVGLPKLEVTWTRALRIYWAFAWRSLLVAFLIGLVVGGLIGFVGALAGASDELVQLVAGMSGWVVGVAVTLWMFRKILKKDFGNFEIVLVPKEKNTESAE